MLAHHDPIVSIITVNFNQTQITRELLRSLRKITYTPIEILVIDNGSSDNSILELCEEFPEIRLIQTGKNLGFAGGNNVGIKASYGEFVLLINNDVEVTPGFLEPLVDTFKGNPRAGLASPKIVYYDREEKIQYAGSSRINPFTGRGIRIGYLEKDDGHYNEVYKTELGHGACLMISRKALEKVGLLPEMYFLYYEEHDWTEKAKDEGFEVYYVGTSKVYHKESVSTGKNSPLKTYYLSRNRILFIRRNTTGLVNLISILFIFMIAVPKNGLQLLFNKDFANLKAYFKGVWWHFKKA